jgi:Predicted hydrolase (metallo-beta-lactamase superfamily)
MDRRIFLKATGAAAVGMAAARLLKATESDALAAEACTWGKKGKADSEDRKKGHFTLKQLTSVTDTIGNSYILRTSGGKVIVIDGGFETEQENLRANIAAEGNHVDLWFITHPHQDHMGAFNEILKDRRGIVIDRIIYSRLPDDFLDYEKANAEDARNYYKTIDSVTEGTDILNLHRTGGRFDIDGIGIMVLGVSNPEYKKNPYNNSSMIIRFWDKDKSVVILGDSGIECGNKALAEYPEQLNCDYMQMAHHGQNGCSEEFYKAVNFRACLWPTPSWVWEPAPQHGHLKTRETRRWMDEKGIKEHHVSCQEKDWALD